MQTECPEATNPQLKSTKLGCEFATIYIHCYHLLLLLILPPHRGVDLLSRPRWLATYEDGSPTLLVVTHPSTNEAQQSNYVDKDQCITACHTTAN